MAAIAMYVQQTFNLPNPPVPGVSATGEDDLEEHAIDPPLGFVSPLNSNGTIFNGARDPIPDPNQYTQVGGPVLGTSSRMMQRLG
jgi:hypothetical protein